jgi:hypothetical protein
MKKFYFLLFTFFFTVTSTYGQAVINEIDADTPGTDEAEFIELKGTPNASLDGLVVVLFNGSSDTSYAAFDLDGKTLDANGFFILANTALVSGEDIDIGASNALQNGADAVAIYTANDTDFPTGTAVTSVGLVDALVYGTSDADDTGLLTGLGETVQYDESANGANDSESLQLNAAGDAYDTKVPTFRASNDSAVCELSLTSTSATCDTVTDGVDTYTATVDFSGGGTSTYTVTADSGTVDLSAGDPSTDATGTITVTGVSEGTDVVISVVDGALCDLSSTVTAASCVPLLTLPITENFDYPDGSLVGNSAWASHGGTAGDFQVLNGQAVVQHGVPSEDVNLPFTSVTGDIYFAFDMVVPDLGVPIGDGGTDFEYFAHFKDSDFGFVAQVDIVAPSATGDYTVGISSDQNVADATWGTDLLYDTTYRITVRYNQDTNIAELWVDASSETDTSILGADEPDPGATIASFAFRQSDSSENEAILVDNLVISQTFDETVLSTSNFDATKFSLYPNPTNTGFVNITSTTADAMNVQVFDILGKQVKNETLVNNKLDVSNLKSGLYMVKITQNNATSTKKLVIN